MKPSPLFRQTFDLAGELLQEHGLSDQGWNLLVASRLQKGVFGYCNYTTKTIAVSAEPLLHLMAGTTVRDTVLHEIAHALAGPGTGHGRAWQEQAIRLGCRPTSCVSTRDIPVSGPARFCFRSARQFVHRAVQRYLSHPFFEAQFRIEGLWFGLTDDHAVELWKDGGWRDGPGRTWAVLAPHQRVSGVYTKRDAIDEAAMCLCMYDATSQGDFARQEGGTDACSKAA